MRVLEMYYSPEQIALALGLHRNTVWKKIAAREFGAGVVNLGSEARPDYRVPASALNEWLAARRVFLEESAPGIVACSLHELRRKVGLTKERV